MTPWQALVFFTLVSIGLGSSALLALQLELQHRELKQDIQVIQRLLGE